MNEIIDILNKAGVICCLAPAGLGIALIMIKMGLGAKEHKHSWKRKDWKYPEDAISGEDKTEVLSSWTTRFHERYKCADEDCGEEKDKFIISNT